MNDKTAHNKLKKINELRNKEGEGRFRDSRRERVKQHEIMNEALKEIELNKYVE